MPKDQVRILRITNRFNLGGPTFNVAYLSKYMDDRFETRLMGGMHDASEASSEYILEYLGLKAEVIAEMRRSISPLKDWKAYWEIRRQIKHYRPQIVHTHAAKSGTLGRLAAIHEGVPIILHTFHGHVFHSYFGQLKTNFYKAIERWLAKNSTRIIAISEIQKHELGTIHEIAPLEKIEVIPLGFDLKRFKVDQAAKRTAFRKEYGLADEDVAIGIVGRLVPVKHHEMFLQAVKLLTTKHENVRFFIIGDGELMDQLQQRAGELSISYSVKASPSSSSPLCFTSWIKDVTTVMAGLDIVALTSLNEGTPVSLIEAQSAGKPVVSTRVGGIEDVVLENESAFLCEVNESERFAKYLEQLIEDPELRMRMGNLGSDHVNQRYTYERLCKDMETLYSNLLNEKHVGSD